MVGLLVVLIWVLLVLLCVGAAVWLVVRVCKRREEVGLAAKVLATLAVLCLISGLAGTLFGLVLTFGAVGGESVDPSQKARVLAEGISEAMNCTAFGGIVLIPAVVALALLIRRRKRRSP